MTGGIRDFGNTKGNLGVHKNSKLLWKYMIDDKVFEVRVERTLYWNTLTRLLSDKIDRKIPKRKKGER